MAGPPEPRPEHYAPRRRALDQDNADWSIMLRSLMVIWSVGATFFLVVLVATDPPRQLASALLPIDIVAFLVLGVLVAGRSRLPRWTLDVCAYLLYVVVGGIITAYGDSDSPYAFFYLWLSVHSFYFLPWRRAAPQVAFIALDYAVSLFAIPGEGFPAVRWAITVLTTIVICTLVALLRARVDALVDRLAGTARTDPLTGLRNRRAYDELMCLEIARAERSGQPLALVLGDLDNFKTVNDRFGHPAGDEVLQRVAAVLQHGERRIDAAVRLGGEEFALVLPNTDSEGGYLVAERMRHGIRSAFVADEVPVTMSFGVASYPDHANDAADLFEAADRALLTAKKTGRDRSVVCGRATVRAGSNRP
jgi:diguanylate cyclase (GGDEF)-like protein